MKRQQQHSQTSPAIPHLPKTSSKPFLLRTLTAHQQAASPSPPFTNTKINTGSTNPFEDDFSLNDRRDFFLHIASCVALATTISSYEDYDCSTLKPGAATLRPDRGAIRGMGYGQRERSYDYGPESLRGIPSYNEVMLQHRSDTIPRWRDGGSSSSSTVGKHAGPDGEKVRLASETVLDALYAVYDLKVMAQDYMWDDMRNSLNSDVFHDDMDRACTVLRNELGKGNDDVRAEIGFHWGSCAWRHCGALADAQEAIAELRNSLGLYEPFECLFCLDIIERSLRDIIAVVPAGFRPKREIPVYEVYKPQGDNEEASIDDDYLSALEKLRVDFLE